MSTRCHHQGIIDHLPPKIFDTTAPLPRGRSLERRERQQTTKLRNKRRHRSASGCQHMDNRPRFEPPTPSHSRSRSPSPTRRAIALLRNAEPPVKIEPESHIPDEGLVADAFEYFMVTQKLPYIPESIAAQLGRLALRKLESTAVGQVTFGNIADSVLVQELDNIVFRAERCERFHQDENAWGNVVRLILDLMLRLHETRSETHREFEVIDLRSQAIDTQFLPQTTSIAAGFTKAFDKRVDFAIAFDIDSDRVKAIHDTTRQAGSNTSLTFSHMSDTYTQLLPLTCPIEVKRKGGNSEEAELQLAIWQAGAFRHRSIEWNEPLEIVRLVPWGEIPQISWTVVGHTWTPYLSWYTAEEGLLFVPVGGADLGTSNRISLLRLIAVFQQVYNWAKADFWTNYEQAMHRRINDSGST